MRILAGEKNSGTKAISGKKRDGAESKEKRSYRRSAAAAAACGGEMVLFDQPR